MSFTKKKYIFTFLTFLMMGLFIELGLHGTRFLIQCANKGKIQDERLTMPPYKNQEWAKVYFEELEEVFGEESKAFSEGYHGQYITIDSKGFRETRNPALFKNRPKTIYILGGSTIFGDGVRDEKTIPSLVSLFLNDSGHQFLIHNFGKPASTFEEEQSLLTQLLEEGNHPDYVIFYDGFNDVLDAYLFKEVGGVEQPRRFARLKDFVASYSMIYQALNFFFRFDAEGIMAKSPAAQYSDEALQRLAHHFVQDYFNGMGLLENLARQFGFQYLSFWQPVTFTEEKLVAEEEKFIDQFFNDKAFGKFYKYIGRALLENSHPHFINLTDALEGRRQMIYTDWCHLSEEGNERVAKKIVEIFERAFLK